jgi:ribosome-associated heat shock protein Hsp15
MMAVDPPDPDTIRLDKWLWQARFFKTRALASKLCASGRVRVDGVVIKKAHYGIRPGFVLTFPQARKIRVIRVLALGERRGPASEAATLYEELVENPNPLPARRRS